VGYGECWRLCVEKQVFVRKGQGFCKDHRMLFVRQQKELLDDAPLKSGPLRVPDRLTLRSPVVFPLASGEVVNAPLKSGPLRVPDRLTLRSPVVFPLASGEVVCALGKSGPPRVPFRLTLRLVFGFLPYRRSGLFALGRLCCMCCLCVCICVTGVCKYTILAQDLLIVNILHPSKGTSFGVGTLVSAYVRRVFNTCT